MQLPSLKCTLGSGCVYMWVPELMVGKLLRAVRQSDCVKNWVANHVERERGLYTVALGVLLPGDLDGNLLHGTNEAEALRLALEGIRVGLCPGPQPPEPRASFEAGPGVSLRGGIEPPLIQVRSSIPPAACQCLWGLNEPRRLGSGYFATFPHILHPLPTSLASPRH